MFLTSLWLPSWSWLGPKHLNMLISPPLTKHHNLKSGLLYSTYSLILPFFAQTAQNSGPEMLSHGCACRTTGSSSLCWNLPWPSQNKAGKIFLLWTLPAICGTSKALVQRQNAIRESVDRTENWICMDYSIFPYYYTLLNQYDQL